MTKIKSQSDLVLKYNQLGEKFEKLAVKYPQASVSLEHLSNRDLFVYIAGETLRHGRDWKDAVENAQVHLKDRVRAEKCFSVRAIDLLGA